MAHEPAEDGRCPACGGAVRELDAGAGECEGCGLALAPADEVLPGKFAHAVRRQLAAGAGLEDALSGALREAGLRLIPIDDGAKQAAVGATEEGVEACPVCGASNARSAEECGYCRIAFGRRPPEECPRCGVEGPEPNCACGAILTLRRLLELFDDSARFVCRDCKQLYTAARPQCPDCGGTFLSTAGLRKRRPGTA